MFLFFVSLTIANFDIENIEAEQSKPINIQYVVTGGSLVNDVETYILHDSNFVELFEIRDDEQNNKSSIIIGKNSTFPNGKN